MTLFWPRGLCCVVTAGLLSITGVLSYNLEVQSACPVSPVVWSDYVSLIQCCCRYPSAEKVLHVSFEDFPYIWHFTPANSYSHSTIHRHTHTFTCIACGHTHTSCKLQNYGLSLGSVSKLTGESRSEMVFCCPRGHCCHMVSLLKHRQTSCPGAISFVQQMRVGLLTPARLCEQPGDLSLIKLLPAFWLSFFMQAFYSLAEPLPCIIQIYDI